MFKGSVTVTDGIEAPANLPKAVYTDRVEGKVDLWAKAQSGARLTDREMQHLFFAIDKAKYGAESLAEFIDAELADNYAQELLVQNTVDNAPRTEEGLIIIQGLPLYPEEAAIAAAIDIEHFREKETHLNSQQLAKEMKNLAVGVWDFMYGEDISTLVDKEAHPVARVWAGIQLIPATKITKALKIAGKFKPVKQITDLWVPGKYRNSIINAYKHAAMHKQEFGYKTGQEYIEKTWEFIQNPPPGTQKFYDKLTKQTVLYHRDSETIAFVLRDGRPQSMYKLSNQKWVEYVRKKMEY